MTIRGQLLGGYVPPGGVALRLLVRYPCSRRESPLLALRTDASGGFAALSQRDAKTAGEVAAATGLARATVSTTLSKLAKTGAVQKAERGYLLPAASASAGADASASPSESADV